MKKSLLLCATALMAASSAFAAVQDGQTYAPTTKNDVTITCKNIWIFDRCHDNAAYVASPLGNADLGGKNYRTATLANGVVYFAGSPSGVGKLLKFDAATGAQIGAELTLTIDGAPLEGTLCANNVIADTYGHILIIGYISAQTEVSEESPLAPVKAYTVDTETGALTLFATLPREHNARIDYFDVIGDITGTEADALIMAAAASDGGWVYRWKLAKGTTEWKGDFDGSVALEMKDFYLNAPEEGAITAWGIAPATKIVMGEGELQFAGELFYIDGFTAAPILYDTFGGVIDSFENAISLAPQTGANGIAEVSIKGRNFIAVANNQHTGSNGGNEVSFNEVGDNMAFEGMERIWLIPANGMNPELVSDGGARFHAIYTQKLVDKNGKEGCYLLTAKCFAGLGIYLIAEEGFELEAGAVEGIEANNVNVVVANGMISVNEASSIEVYNMAGQKVVEANASQVAAPAAGAYIVKANVNGNAVVEKVIL